MDKTNAQRFIQAYNTIDQTLRVLYNFKRSMSFSDIVRRSVPVNYLVRKYEDKLVDYGRLRNAIVHKSNDEFIIAEPHGDVVLDIENIAKLISTPPKALELIKHRNVVTSTHDTKIFDIIKLMAKTEFSNIPIYKDGEMIGVITNKYIVEALGTALENNINIDAFSKTVAIENIMETINPVYSYFEVANCNISVEEVLQKFSHNYKLNSIIITKSGSTKEQPINIITTGDLMDLSKVFEDYNI